MRALVLESSRGGTRVEERVASRVHELNEAAGVRAFAMRGSTEPAELTTVIELENEAASAPTPAKGAIVRRYRVIADYVNDGYDASRIRSVQGIWFDTADSADMAAWYRDEHMSLLFRVPGWLRCRRGELISGGGPRFLALHELTGPEVATDPIGEAARNTPWRDRVMAEITASERELYRLLP